MWLHMLKINNNNNEQPERKKYTCESNKNTLKKISTLPTKKLESSLKLELFGKNR
jgi:hypothetical protein